MTESRRPSSPGAEEILGLYFPVLDHGFVSLVDYMGTDECIERAARVSYGYGTRKAQLTRGLLRYLRRHLHTTPTEMVELKFHCCMPMFVARQWIRHRTACLAGDAQLYFDLPGAQLRGGRQRHNVAIADFHRMWTTGTEHPIAKKKPLFVSRIDAESEYTIPELARLVERREETLREYVRSGALDSRRGAPASREAPATTSAVPLPGPPGVVTKRVTLVSGRAWHAFALRQPTAKVPMRERLSKMRLRSCDEKTGEIIHTQIVDVWESGVKPVFRVTLENGYSLEMSKDHRCLTERGWLTLEQATGLQLSERGSVSWRQEAPAFSVNGAPAYRDREWLGAQRAAGLSVDEIAQKAGISYHSIRKYLKLFGLGFTAGEKARLSGLTQRGQRRTSTKPRTLSPEHLATIRRARSGTASNFWKGGTSTERESIGRWTTQASARVHARFGYACAVCAAKGRLHAHHVDPVWHNPSRARDEQNLISLCRQCHDRLHADNLELALLEAVASGSRLEGFWSGRERQPRPKAKRGPATTRLVRRFSKVARIEYVGQQMTYDLEVAGPYHNFVANGFVVHNSVNEYSGRYSLMPMLFYTPSEAQLQTQSAQNNQGRSGQSVPTEQYQEAITRWNEIRRLSQSAYEWMTNEEIARELARIDLPLSTYTQWYWKIDLHNLQHFLKLRVDTHAQWEIQEYGRVMAGMLKKLAPHSYEAWIDYDVCGARMSRMELDALRKLVEESEQGLSARADARLDTAALEAVGLSKRELTELRAKLAPATRPDFELDLSQARSAEHFAERMNAAVPKVERAPTE